MATAVTHKSHSPTFTLFFGYQSFFWTSWWDELFTFILKLSFNWQYTRYTRL
ncbi:MAG: hypothetical protein J6568_03850 [Snodgrassella sp.]|nr:hypothetical protein [Snodgrassella sp.]